MAEAVAAFYAVETVVEGAAVGALAVSGSTVPLHAHFKKLALQAKISSQRSSTANVLKSKIYIIGGDDAACSGGVHTLSLPMSYGESTADGNKPVDTDYELRTPEITVQRRPLQSETEHLEDASSKYPWWRRSKHTSVTVEDRIYILGGHENGHITSLNTTYSYDSLTNDYKILHADNSRSTEGLPAPRHSASATASPYPPSVSAAEADGPTLISHGTIFLHGGFDSSNTPLHDTWTFDIGTRAWHKFPSIIQDALSDKSTPGVVVYVEGRLWYVNSATVMYLELAEHDPATSETASNDPATMSTGRVGSGQWQVVYPPPEADPASTVVSSPSNPKSGQAFTSYTSKDASAPLPAGKVPETPTSHVVPITTGAGRIYLVSFSDKNPQSMWLFQMPSSAGTATSLKDKVRDKASSAIKSLPDSWKSGKYQWSKVEVVQSSMAEGEAEKPSENMEGFAVASMEEYGDQVLLWGGVIGAEPSANAEGWIVRFD